MRKNKFSYVDSLTTRLAIYAIEKTITNKRQQKDIEIIKRYMELRHSKSNILTDSITIKNVRETDLKSIFPNKNIQQKVMKTWMAEREAQ